MSLVGALLAAGIGAAQGATIRLERRAGVLWARMPAVGLWLWALLVVTRVGMMAVAHVVDAKVAASSATILLMLGVNRLGQALVLVPRVMSSGMAFAPERGGRTFPEQVSQRFTPPPLDEEAPGRPHGAAPAAPYADGHQGDRLDLIRSRRQQRRARGHDPPSPPRPVRLSRQLAAGRVTASPTGKRRRSTDGGATESVAPPSVGPWRARRRRCLCRFGPLPLVHVLDGP
ncbi:hypothetical protein [Streptomyces violaceusniger]|uniref:Uncharacterized protein n=1 Tax=Streptomyces violaceusniger (strain Tu 4113) TaxID=653045 RepID=G2NXD7_STRV4|nr:hypothetical protein [Streptomyces violaceusniger]AEM87540.1 hypothetical protein Strvi_8218 [Streptomyces violaceusniger Tu 4113]